MSLHAGSGRGRGGGVWRAALAVATLLAGCGPGVGASGPVGPRAAVPADAVHERCRPEGLRGTPGVAVPYCDAYDEAGRERLAGGRTRRVVGYFADWRTGVGGREPFLVSDVPWSELTHLAYAFAWVDGAHRVSVGDPEDPANPALSLTWPDVPGAGMDETLPYRGHFNLLARLGREHPEVKRLLSVGGWGASGGYVGPGGRRMASGGFYAMTTHPDGSLNRAGIEVFAASVVETLRRYDFDGVDIDWEYPSTMAATGNPLDEPVAGPRRPHLVRGWEALVTELRGALDRAAAEDRRYYLLTAALPASAHVLRGMAMLPGAERLDFVNVMSYDLHGPWNEHVGHLAPLYDDGRDPELEAWGVYRDPAFGGVGYLNADWAHRYYRGALPPGRINLGVPFYTRGWRDVEGGRWGMGGRALLTDSLPCPESVDARTPTGCSYGARGVDDLWGGGGHGPLWHWRNLAEGILPSYLGAYGVEAPAGGLEGRYEVRYDAVSEGAWLWNETRRVVLSGETERSLDATLGYVDRHGLGGVAIWELAGDYGWRDGEGEYRAGSTLTARTRARLEGAGPYDTAPTDLPPPERALELRISVVDVPIGEENYPLRATLEIENTGAVDLPAGSELRFLLPTSTPDTLGASPAGFSVVRSGHPDPDNVGGLDGTFHTVATTLDACLPAGGTARLELVHFLPASGPTGWRVRVGGASFGVAADHPEVAVVRPDEEAAAALRCGPPATGRDDGIEVGPAQFR